MTVTARNDSGPFTDGDDVRVRVRGPEMARVLPLRPDSTPGSAHARAIQDEPRKGKSGPASKVRNFASRHGGEANEALANSWLAHSTLRPLGDAWQLDLTLAGFAPSLFRAAVCTIAHLMCAAVDTNKRAAVTFTLLTLSLTSAWAISALAG